MSRNARRDVVRRQFMQTSYHVMLIANAPPEEMRRILEQMCVACWKPDGPPHHTSHLRAHLARFDRAVCLWG